jgi:hypothetical protein
MIVAAPRPSVWVRVRTSLAPRGARPSARAVATAAVFVGLALRVGWYAADPCVWWDESWLMLNVLTKSFAELAGPLDYNQAAPPAFLWAAKSCVALFGDGTHALRLVPFVASCAALVLVFAVGGGYPRAAVPAAVVLLAGSSKMLGHTAEFKPYTLDVCTAAALAAWFCRSADRPLVSRVQMACGACPVAVLLVYPGCFLAGGVLLGLAVVARRRNELAWLALAGALTGAAFAVLMAGPAGAQRVSVIHDYWADLGHFPDWSRPRSLPGWVLSGVTGVFRYSLYPLGVAFVPFAAVGFAALWRGGRRDVAVFLAGPLAVALAAGLLGKYPFGGSRLHLYAAPGLALLSAVGVRLAWDRLAEFAPARARVGRAALVVVVGWGVAEGALFPLFESARVDVRPAVEFLRARPAGEPGVTYDHVFGYYLRRDPGVYFLCDPPAESGRVWVGGTADRRVPDTIEALRARAPRRVGARHEFGPAVVVRLDPASE